MSVRRHGRGWQIRFQYAGGYVSRVVRTTKAEAQQVERRLRTELERGAAGFPGRHTLEDAFARWLTGEALALDSYDDVRAKVRHWIPWASRPLLDAPGVASEAKTKWLRAGLKPATINRRLSALRRVCNLARSPEWKWTEAHLGEQIKEVPGETPRYVKATPEQAEALLAACRRPRIADAVVVAVLTGLRQGEMLRLDPARHYEPGRIILVAKKTKTPRVIPLAPEAEALVKTFPLGLSYNQLRYGFEQAREEAGLPWLQWRDLRRTFGSWVVQRTGSLKAAQDLLGHSTSQITSKHYAHLLTEHLDKAISSLPSMAIGQKLAKELKPLPRKPRKKHA